MTIYHMETEVVRGMASRLQSTAEEMQSQLQSLASSAQSVDWMGDNRNQFEVEMQQLVRTLMERAEEGVVLSSRTAREVDEWEHIGDTMANTPFALPIIIIGSVIGVTGIAVVGSIFYSWWMSKTIDGLTKEEARSKIEDILDNSDAGRKALAEAKRLGVQVELGQQGKGTYYDPNTEPPTMYLDPLTQEDVAASSFIHELTHATQDQARELGNPTTVSKGEYIENCLRNEADAVIAELRYEKENFILDKMSHTQYEISYWEAYDQKLKELKNSGISMSSTELENIANDFGRDKILNFYRDGTITTSTTRESYVDYYSNYWEQANVPTNSVM